MQSRRRMCSGGGGGSFGGTRCSGGGGCTKLTRCSRVLRRCRGLQAQHLQVVPPAIVVASTPRHARARRVHLLARASVKTRSSQLAAWASCAHRGREDGVHERCGGDVVTCENGRGGGGRPKRRMATGMCRSTTGGGRDRSIASRVTASRYSFVQLGRHAGWQGGRHWRRAVAVVG